ncbi:pitrilysin family protein [Oscillatoria sp. FACHB-1406]|uniref:M16 family metallopeptidase n=1 Tax=Oscillatoria sp. FACHB-1406 TaxID=2692846 RepID=UPI0016861FE0|nr:pitrilysin family protein [Oscillatoria sp. FACHB-1406]MBD2578913.1 insulinase family protein [Oscillatoria sp. FACHB-1406]
MKTSKSSFLRRNSPFNWLGWLAIALFLVVSLRAPAIASSPQHYTNLVFPTLKDIQVPQYERYQLENGLTVFLMPDRELPLVSGTAMVRAGSRWEPAEKVGLAELTGTVMRSGGTLEHPADELNQMLEQKAAIVEASIGDNFGSVSFNTLSEDLSTTFKLFAEVIQEPAFVQDKLDLAKKQTEGAIARRNDDPDDIASREFQKLLYGSASPYARTVEYKTLNNISRADVVQFYQTYFRPETTILGIVGDFEPSAMKALVQEAFGSWKSSSPKPTLTPPSATQETTSGLFLADRPQLNQSYIQMGHIGGLLNNPDYPALSVLNGVLNGFGGRLFNEVRSRQGLAYVAYGYWSAQFDYPGSFILGGQTRSEGTVPFIKAMYSEIDRIRTTPISAEELNYAKESILNSFVFNFDDPSKFLARLMRYEYYGYPADFIFKYQRAVKAVTVEDVQRVAGKYLQPGQILTLVVGNQAEIQSALKGLNSNVQTVDVTIPQP